MALLTYMLVCEVPFEQGPEGENGGIVHMAGMTKMLGTIVATSWLLVHNALASLLDDVNETILRLLSEEDTAVGTSRVLLLELHTTLDLKRFTEL